MDFAFWPAVLAGLAGGLVMTAMMTVMRRAGKTEMDMAPLQGTMVTGDRGKAKVIGLMSHLVMMSAVVFGSVYALLFTWFDVSPGNTWWVGALIGACTVWSPGWRWRWSRRCTRGCVQSPPQGSSRTAVSCSSRPGCS